MGGMIGSATIVQTVGGMMGVTTTEQNMAVSLHVGQPGILHYQT